MKTTTRSTRFDPFDPLASMTCSPPTTSWRCGSPCGSDRIDPFVTDWFERGEIPDVRGLTKELGALGVLGTATESSSRAKHGNHPATRTPAERPID